jgi:outer membrane receptor protein involved in Fe transport
MRRPPPPLAPLGLCLAAACAPLALAQQSAERSGRVSPLEAPTVEVIADTPLPGLGAPREQIPANVQAVTGEQIRRSESATLPDFLESALPSVNVNQAQGNPYQADVNYRGFSASPRLGIPQGLSVYLDGVRINEPFGDIVNWDLIPQSSIANLNLIPGSNPLYGLNTLGGALSLRTKSGETAPGTTLEASAGRFGRRALGAEHGGERAGWGWYANGNGYEDDGWRDFAESRVGSFFGKLGKEEADYDIDLSLLYADTRLIGNQVTPNAFLQQRWESIYTYPDITHNEAMMANLAGSRWIAQNRVIGGNVYYRRVRSNEFNLDVNEVTDARFGVGPFEDGPNDGVGNIDSVSINRLSSSLNGYGMTVQFSWLGSGANRATAGTTWDHGRTDFRQSYQLGQFNDDRGGFATGSETESVNLLGRTTTWSVFATGTIEFADAWQLTAAGRYNRTQVETEDRIAVPFPPPAQGLDNDFRYTKFNPAIGVTYNPGPAFSAYAGFNQGNRAPSPIELGCADRNAPCLLSNAFGSDPFLNQVVARTGEAGVRGRAGDLGWQFGLYRTELKDDILFVSTSTSAGFFSNFGKTRRQGIEAGLNGRFGGGFGWSAHYSLIDATFESSAVLLAENNSTRGTVAGLNDDEILVSPGDRIPGIPRHAFKLNLDWESGAFGLGAQFVAFSDQFVRGNENNRHQAGTFTDLLGETRTFEGSGKSPGYAVLNLTGRWRPAKNWEVFGKITNLFDRRYTTGGVLGENAFPTGSFAADSEDWRRETFFAPGAPRAFWVGIRWSDAKGVRD